MPPQDAPAYPPVLDTPSWTRLAAIIPPVTKAKPALTSVLKKLKVDADTRELLGSQYELGVERHLFLSTQKEQGA